jgi:hypothetical protein
LPESSLKPSSSPREHRAHSQAVYFVICTGRSLKSSKISTGDDGSLSNSSSGVPMTITFCVGNLSTRSAKRMSSFTLPTLAFNPTNLTRSAGTLVSSSMMIFTSSTVRLSSRPGSSITRSRHLHERLTRRNSGSASFTTASTRVGAGAGAAQGFSSLAAPLPILLLSSGPLRRRGRPRSCCGAAPCLSLRLKLECQRGCVSCASAVGGDPLSLHSVRSRVSVVGSRRCASCSGLRGARRDILGTSFTATKTSQYETQRLSFVAASQHQEQPC